MLSNFGKLIGLSARIDADFTGHWKKKSDKFI